MSTLEDVVQETKGVIGAIIRKPKMSEKLLNRPPFRFLHDTVMALNAVSSFVDDLLEDQEKDSSNIKDKESKIAFLEKLIAFAGICSGTAIDVRASKIVAGAEPEKTNVWLTALGRACTDDSIDFQGAAKAVAEGKAPGSVPRKSSESSEEKNQDEEKRPELRRKEETQKTSKQEVQKAEHDVAPAVVEEEKKPVKNKESKQDDSSFDLSKVDGEIPTTIELFDGLITRPKLSEKLLSKPPFRFLHDVVTNLGAGSGLVEGLFQGAELNSKECTTKELKLAYLEKLTQFAGVCAGQPVPVKPSRIVAGHEPENTNKLLQTLALIVRNDCTGVISASQAVAIVMQADMDDNTEAKTSEADVAASVEKNQRTSDSIKSNENNKDDVQPEQKVNLEESKVDATESSRQRNAEQQQQQEEEGEGEEEQLSSGVFRPQTARKRPPKIREKAAEVTSSETTRGRGDVPAPVGVMMDGDIDSEGESDHQPEDDEHLRRNTLDSESNPATGTQDLKGKLVRDILDAERKQDEEKEENPANEAKTNEVTGITMGKIGQGLRRGSKMTSSGGSTINVDQIRSAVQTLCQSTNPLGKCMDYVHQDLNVMNKELERWREEYRKSCDALEDEQRTTNETLLPLRGKLLDVEERIKDEQVRLSTLKASIAKNDQRIAELVRDMVLG